MSHPEKSESLKSEIENRLFGIQEYIEFKKRTNREITYISELFLEELLNEIYKGEGYHFENMNHKIPGYPAIDIADENKGISYQVTVTNDSSDLKTKVNKTLEIFYKNNFDKKYNKLYIVIASGIKAGEKLPHKKIFNINGHKITVKPNLFTSKNIIDLSGLAQKEIFKRTAKFENINNVLLKISNRPEKKNTF
ncbi:MAG: SMEK domain-containing protein [Mariniphaga sp.]|nr:SMEK domain-containing protein [Mariniphaga sp.]